MNKLVILISGNGSNLQAIIDSTQNDVLPYCEISAVISNRKQAFGLERAINSNINAVYFPKKKIESREAYDTKLATEVQKYNPDLIVLAGWMRILTPKFISQFEKGSIINLHPALPGQFPGDNGIGDAFQAYQDGTIKQTGVMVHEVIEELDAGKVLETCIVDIHNTDTLETLSERVKKFEKRTLVNAIFNKLYSRQTITDSLTIRKGKVRDIIPIQDDMLLFIHSDRLSSFDRHICNIKGKGKLLCETASWWFQQSKYIVDNHYLWHRDNVMVVKKCTPIPLEIVVRNYLTGSTNTSVWTHYNHGVRNYCGNDLPDGLVKNQILPQTIITPTTKDTEHDRPISAVEILRNNILTNEEWDYISTISLLLFHDGVQIAKKCGLILVDTKYEFGRDANGKIILIDEVHTPDSSRYWKLDSYLQRFEDGEEPERLDKDVIREYLKKVDRFNPYNVEQPIPEIPESLKQQVFDSYSKLYDKLTISHSK